MKQKVERDVEDINTAMSDDINDGDDATEDVEAIVLNQLMGAAEEVRNAKKVRIIMYNQEGPAGNQPVFVAVNGMGYSIPREVPVVIPEPILRALEDAVETRYYRDEIAGQPFGDIQERQVRRFTFSLI